MTLSTKMCVVGLNYAINIFINNQCKQKIIVN